MLHFKYLLLGHCFSFSISFRLFLISTFPSVGIFFALVCATEIALPKTNGFCFTIPKRTDPVEMETIENKVKLSFGIIFEFEFGSKIGTNQNVCQFLARQYDTNTHTNRPSQMRMRTGRG